MRTYLVALCKRSSCDFVHQSHGSSISTDRIQGNSKRVSGDGQAQKKVPDQKRRQQFHHTLSNQFFQHPLFVLSVGANRLIFVYMLIDAFLRLLINWKRQPSPAWLPGFTPHFALTLVSTAVSGTSLGLPCSRYLQDGDFAAGSIT